MTDSGSQARTPSGASEATPPSTRPGTEIHVCRQLNGPYRWRAWFSWYNLTPNFEAITRNGALRKAKRHLRRLRKVEQAGETSIWA